MEIWKIFWLIIIVFSIVSFTYMSFKIITKGFVELKELLHKLGEQ